MNELHSSSGRLLGPVARVLGCTEGQLYTIATGASVAAVLALSSVHGAAPAGAEQALPAPVVTVPSAPVAVATPTALPLLPLNTEVSQPAQPVPFPVAEPTYGEHPPTASIPSLKPGQVVEVARVSGPSAVSGVAVAKDGTTWITTRVGTTTSGPSRLLGFSASGHQLHSFVLSGQPAGHPHSFSGVTALSDGSVIVLDADDARVLRIDPGTGTQSLLTRVPDLPACLFAVTPAPCEPGVTDRLPHPASVVPGPEGALLISDPSQDTIWTWRQGSPAAPLYQSSYDVQGDGPTGLARAEGAVLFTVGATLDPAARGGGALYRMPLPDHGPAGTPVLKAAFSRDEHPGSVATGLDGIVYVALRGTAALVTVDGQGAVHPLSVSSTSGSKIDGPWDLALAPGRLLVTNQPPTGAKRPGELLAIGVPDAPFNDRD